METGGSRELALINGLSTTALLLRLLYYLFPMVDWAFVFVDDFCSLLRSILASPHACALLATLLALGTPLS